MADQPFPSQASPFVVDELLTIARPWRELLQTLWVRTGRGPGIPRTDDLLASFNATVPTDYELVTTDTLAGQTRYWYKKVAT